MGCAWLYLQRKGGLRTLRGRCASDREKDGGFSYFFRDEGPSTGRKGASRRGRVRGGGESRKNKEGGSSKGSWREHRVS